MIKILLLERNVILSDYLKNYFSRDNQLEIIETLTNGKKVIEYLNNNNFDVDLVLMDQKQTNGLVIIDQIRREFPKVKIICFSTCEKDRKRAIELGAIEYFYKYETTLVELIHGIKMCLLLQTK